MLPSMTYHSLNEHKFLCFSACAEGVVKFDVTATEEDIKMDVSEHLKHAPQRHGGGGFTQD